MYKKFTRYEKQGFTLIELLVVIAIIGVLSAVVLASLNTARSKGDTAAILANLNSIRSQAELDFTTNGCYSNTSICNWLNKTSFPPTPPTADNTIFADPVIIKQIQAATASGTGLSSVAVGKDNKSYAIAIQLKLTSSGVSQAYCMDSTGKPPTLKTVSPNTQTAVTNLIQTGSSSLCL